MVKNYMVITTTGKSCYSTHARAYKIVDNKPVLIGELHGQSDDYAVRYLCDIMRAKGSKIKVLEQYQEGKINIHEIKL